MITLICGIGRAGKTIYSSRFDNVIHIDALGHIPERYERANDIVREAENIVVEGIYNLADYRQKLLKACKDEYKKCIWLDTPKYIVEERMRRDGIPISITHFNFEPPTYSEGWDEIVVIKGDSDG